MVKATRIGLMGSIGLFLGAASGNALAFPVVTVATGFEFPTDVLLDGSNNVYVSDFGRGEIREITAASSYQTINTVVSGLNGPNSLAFDSSLNLYIADNGQPFIDQATQASNYATVNNFGT